MPEVQDYKGNKILCLNPDVEYAKARVQFGVTKAKLILEHFDTIKKFVQENDKPKETAKKRDVGGKKV